MTNGVRFGSCLAAILLSWTTTSAEAGGDCWRAPQCWQYHRDVCFGYYQTKWRRWDAACGPMIRPVDAAAMPKSTLREPGQLISMGSPQTVSSPATPSTSTTKKPSDVVPAVGAAAAQPTGARLPMATEPAVDAAWASGLRLQR